MRWSVITQYRAIVNTSHKAYNIVCEQNKKLDDGYSLSINGEYVCQLPKLPTEAELLEYIDDFITLNSVSGMPFGYFGYR